MPKAIKSSKTKKEKQIHPNSRKASQLNRALHKEEKKLKRKDDQKTKTSSLCEKLLWFQSQLDGDKTKYSLEDVADLITKYVNRFGNRLQEIKELEKFHKEQGRHGRLHAAEEDGIKMILERDHTLFVSGQFEAPDITNRKNLKLFRAISEPNVFISREWDGQHNGIPSIKLKLFKKAPIDVNTHVMETVLKENE